LIISSNASTNATKSSCFAWSTSSNDIIWKSAGIMSSPVEDSYPSHAEAFGIFAALDSSYNILHTFQLNSPLLSYESDLDNQGTIQWIEK